MRLACSVVSSLRPSLTNTTRLCEPAVNSRSSCGATWCLSPSPDHVVNDRMSSADRFPRRRKLSCEYRTPSDTVASCTTSAHVVLMVSTTPAIRRRVRFRRWAFRRTSNRNVRFDRRQMSSRVSLRSGIVTVVSGFVVVVGGVVSGVVVGEVSGVVVGVVSGVVVGEVRGVVVGVVIGVVVGVVSGVVVGVVSWVVVGVASGVVVGVVGEVVVEVVVVGVGIVTMCVVVVVSIGFFVVIVVVSISVVSGGSVGRSVTVGFSSDISEAVV